MVLWHWLAGSPSTSVLEAYAHGLVHNRIGVFGEYCCNCGTSGKVLSIASSRSGGVPVALWRAVALLAVSLGD